MGYSVGYHAGESTSCSRTGCEAGGLLVAGQLQVNAVNDGDANISKEQKRNIQRRHKTPAKLPGYGNLKQGDRTRVRESIGWDEDAQSTSGNQNSNNRSDGKTDAKGKRRAKEPEHKTQGNAPASSRQHAETVPISPEPSQSWFENAATWDDPEPPKAPQETARVNNRKEREDVNKQEGRRNAQSEAHFEPVTPQVRIPSQANGSRQPKQPSKQDPWDEIQATPRSAAGYDLGATRSDPYEPLSPEGRLEIEPSAAPSGPPAPAKAEIDSVVVMRLELEDAEAEARLAEAELLLAETRVKVESARRAVIAQKLKMARAGVSV
ncbi:hypothetical protein FRC04_004068 [Tulasnella sp. 424]|nr:hypothetical protein FRC04_004068 [Tulasnella sp. 424]